MENLTPLKLARKVGLLALDKKGFDVKVLKLQNISTVCDYFVIASGDVDVHVKAIAGNIIDEMKKEGVRPYHVEGLNDGNWILVDYVDVVVHIFQEKTRNFYALEKLWGDAPIEELSDE